jgi:hypothetical protein
LRLPSPPSALAAAVLVIAAAGQGCKSERPPPAKPTAAAPKAKAKPKAPVLGKLLDVTRAMRIRFKHHPVQGTRPGDQFKMNHYVHGSGMACGDIDGDGRVDLYLMDQAGPNQLLRNLGGMRFQDVTLGADVALDDRVPTAATFADMDRDGDLDLLVAGIRTGIAVLANDGSGRFEDRSKGSGLEVNKGHISVIGLIDGDGDGLLDVFAGHNAVHTLKERFGPGEPHIGVERSMGFKSAAERSHYYVNKGDLQFAEAGPESGIEFSDWAAGAKRPDPTRMFWAGDAVVTDLEPDGMPDLVISNMGGSDRWYRGLGGGRFEDVSHKAITRSTFGAFGLAVLDFNNDGRLDMATADMHSDMYLQPSDRLESVDWKVKHTTVAQMWDPALRARFIFGNALYESSPDGPMADVSARAGVENMMPWAVLASDFDLDGDEDLFYAAGMGWPWDYSPDFLYLNQGDGTFKESSKEVGMELPFWARMVGGTVKMREGKQMGRRSGKSHNVASRTAMACDFDDDGDHDLVIMRWGSSVQIFENRIPPEGARSLVLSLKGTDANPDAVGARVDLVAGGQRQVRIVPGTTGYLSSPDRRLLFGIPPGAEITRVAVTWPYGRTEELDPATLVPGPKAHRITQTPDR